MEHKMRVIARVHSDFSEKFGIPRQAGLVEDLEAEVVFEPAFRNPDALRGLEQFSHIWLIWEFSEAVRETWRPTVRPPRLGGNARMGVFATRSPFRPNPIGLSCVRLLGLSERAGCGTVLRIAGADLMDGTPIFDIKPYIPYADAKPDASCGFAARPDTEKLRVEAPEELLRLLPEAKRAPLMAVLRQDPRPQYQNDPTRVYAMRFSDYTVRFTVAGSCLTVCAIEREEAAK